MSFSPGTDQAMPSRERADGNPGGAKGWLPPTPWTQLVLARTDSEAARRALDEVLRLYWQPIKRCIERSGFDSHAAEDLTQEFLSDFARKGHFERVDRERGRLRSYLLVALRHFILNVRRHRAAQRRGGGDTALSLDAPAAEGGAGEVASEANSPDLDFDREWAATLLSNVLASLKEELAARGQGKLFEVLGTALTPQGVDPDLAEAGRQLDLSPGAVRVALHRLRLRYRNLLFRQVASTVSGEHEIEDEIRGLVAALRRR